MALSVEILYNEGSAVEQNGFLMKEGVIDGREDSSLLPQNVSIGERSGIATVVVHNGKIFPKKGEIEIKKLKEKEIAMFCGIGKEVKIKSSKPFSSNIKEIIVRQVFSE